MRSSGSFSPRPRGRLGRPLALVLALALLVAPAWAGGALPVAGAAGAQGYQPSALYAWPPVQSWLFAHGSDFYVLSWLGAQLVVTRVDAAGDLQRVASLPVPATDASGTVQQAAMAWDATGRGWLALEVVPSSAGSPPDYGSVYAGPLDRSLARIGDGALDPNTIFWTSGSQLYLRVLVPSGQPHSFLVTDYEPAGAGWQKAEEAPQAPRLSGALAAAAWLGDALYALEIQSPGAQEGPVTPQPSDVVEAVRVAADGGRDDLGSPGTYGQGEWKLALAGGQLVALHYDPAGTQATLYRQGAGGWAQETLDLGLLAPGVAVRSWLVTSFAGTEDGRLGAAVQAVDTAGRTGFYVALLAPGGGTGAVRVVQVDLQQLAGGPGGPASFQHRIRLVIGQRTALRDGQPFTLEAAPFVRVGRTLLPVRFVSEAMGFQVGWEPGTRTVTIAGNGVQIRLVVGSTTAQVDGRPVQLDVPPVIVAGRTFVPVRFVGESLGARVGWDPQARAVTVEW